MRHKHALLVSALACAITAPAQAELVFSNETAQTLTSAIEDGRYGPVTSALILHEGEVVYEGYFNGADAETLHDTRSAGKTVTGMLAGLLVDQGVMTVDQPLAPLFEDIQPFDYPDPRKQEITLEDLLTMSGPLDCDDWNQFSRGNEERMYTMEDWDRFFWDLPLRGYPSWTTPPRVAAYGRNFSYCTAGVQIAGEALSQALGEDLEAFAERELFQPLGIERHDWPRTGSGRMHLGGGLRLSTRDWARLGELQRNQGRHEGRQVLSEAWTSAAVTPHAAMDGQDYEYGYLWWLGQADGAAGEVSFAMMTGNGGNRVWVIEEEGLTVVLTKTEYATRGMHERADLFLSEAVLANLR